MGFRFRKSINLGGGFRINLSKSGVGYSWGVPGARITHTARGTTRTTVGIPGSGLSYTTESSNRHTNTRHNSSATNEVSNTYNSRSSEIIDIDSYQSAEYSRFLKKIRKVKNLNITSISLIIFGLVLMPMLLEGIYLPNYMFFGGLILLILVHTFFPMKLDYEMDSCCKERYDYLIAIWDTLNKNKQIWQQTSESNVINSKYSAGVKSLIDRRKCKISRKCPYYIKTNIKPICLELKKKKLLFLPDKLLVITDSKVGAINYNDISISIDRISFTETESVPKDAKIINTTWLKVNKDGSPDRRFSNNQRLPVCEYGELIIESKNLYVELIFSNSELM